jgi:hypothetical protein
MATVTAVTGSKKVGSSKPRGATSEEKKVMRAQKERVLRLLRIILHAQRP